MALSGLRPGDKAGWSSAVSMWLCLCLPSARAHEKQVFYWHTGVCVAVLQTVASLKCLLCLWQISDQGLKLNYPSKCCLLTLVLHGSLCCKHSLAFLQVQLAAMLHLFLSFCRIRDRGAPLSVHCLCLCKGSFHFACHNLHFCFKPSKF